MNLSPENIPKLMAYYKACYQADNRELHIYNFLGSQVEAVEWLEEAGFLQGQMDTHPVDSLWGAATYQHLLLNQKEKELLLGVFFLIGKAKYGMQQKVDRVCAPLLFMPVELIQEGEIFFLRSKQEPLQLNPAVVRLLEHTHSAKENNFTAIYEQLMQEMPSGPIGFDACFQIEKSLQRNYPLLHIKDIHQYPELVPVKEVNQQLKSINTNNQFSLLPAAAVGVINKSNASKGILHDLDLLSKGETFAAPIHQLFSSSVQAANKQAPVLFSPANLSLPQQEILHAAQQYELTQVIGPPGTGKSFTIAALAIDAMARGQSVLIASKYDQAVDVVAQKIAQDLGITDITIRSGRSRNYQSAFRQKLSHLISGVGRTTIHEPSMRRSYERIQRISARIMELEQILAKKEESALLHGAFLSSYTGGFLQVFKRFFIERKIQKATPYWRLITEWEQLINQRVYLVKDYVQTAFKFQLHEAVRKDRQTFTKLLQGVQRNGNMALQEYFQQADFELLFKALPIWLSNTKEVSHLLPLKAGLFDLVILDEASQCDIASAIPVLQRGKRAVIVGDPQQLRHLSFLSRKRQRQLQSQFGLFELQGDALLDYRDRSILDMIALKLPSQDQIHFLNEHYRSQPDIIAFSNQAFYQNALHVMTERPGQTSNGNVHLHVLDGQRSDKGYNEKEAHQLLTFLKQSIKKEENEGLTYGILSPFRAQVDYLKKLASDYLSLDQLGRHAILIGTPYHFQGEEKDVMLLSMTVDDEAHPSSFQYLNRNDVLNVSITRARKEQHIFLSGDPKRWNQDIMLVQYLESLARQKDQQSQVVLDGTGDTFTHEVSQALWELGIQSVKHQQSIAGFEVDIVFEIEGKLFGIDLVGYPGLMEQAFPAEHFQMLKRLGVSLLVIPYGNWVVNRAECINELRLFIQKGVGTL